MMKAESVTAASLELEAMHEPVILVVDDTPANLSVLVDHLESHGLQIVIAQDGHEAIQRAQYVRPDLILLDVMMPGINGFDTCRQLKLIQQVQDIPIIFMTALTDTEDKIKGFDAGGIDYITKPFQMKEVLARVRTHLTLCKTQKQLQRKNALLSQEIRERKKAEYDLNILANEQQTILESAGVGIAFLDECGKIIRVNHTFVRMFGYSEDALINKTPIEMLAPDAIFPTSSGLNKKDTIINDDITFDVQYQRQDNSLFWGETILNMIDRNNKEKGTILVINDISERKQIEVLRDGQNKILEIMTKNATLTDIFNKIIQLIEMQQSDSKCAILMMDDDQQHLRHYIAPGLPESYLKAVGRIKIDPHAGSSGVAAYTREPVFVQDIDTDPRWENYRAFIHPYGFKSCWSIPIISDDNNILGCFAMYQTETRHPTQQDITLANTAVYLTRIAIERQQAQEKIHYMAHHDVLTGLPNRALLEDRLTQAILYAHRYQRLVTVAFIDLDNFKLINDTLGHNIGDELLKSVADRMQMSVRQSDTVVRLGGDEFVLVLFDQPQKTELIGPTLKRIQQEISQPLTLDGHAINIMCSIGVAVYPTDGQNVDTLMMNADAAMYQAKANGRNTIQMYTPDMNLKIQRRLAQTEELRNALIRKEFVFFYQPQIDLKNNRIFGVEALIRWNHPEKGLVSPAEFISLAEETGLIIPIGDLALRTACLQNKAWQAAGLPPITVSVNVSARQFQEKDLVKRVATALEGSKLEPKYLELELTESLIMHDVAHAIETMQELNRIGVQLSIDDFGTGYSSLSSLKCFPVSRLKIDKSFVEALSEDSRNMAIAKTIITMGHQMNLKVIAEGVETNKQLQFLKDNDCDEMQGFCFSKPIPATDCEQLLRQSGQVKFKEWLSDENL